ncbi:AAA family ATPase [Actinomycetes bacterium NPDC127524]
MKIRGVRLENYRSVKELNLNNLGNMNVFVGKNNSGKSTVLKSIEVFTNSLSETLITKVLGKKDFHRSQTDNPIKIACSIELKDEKFQGFIQKMKKEYPQLVSGIEGLINYKIINIYTSSYNYQEHTIYSHIEKITLSETSPFNGNNNILEKEIISINIPMIEELIKRDLQHQHLSQVANSFKEAAEDIGSDDYIRYKENKRRYAILPKYRNNQTILEFLESTRDYSDFKSRVQDEADAAFQEIENILSKETENEINVFAGRAKVVPNHITWLLNEIQGIKILQESERKEPIEKDDAKRLLNLKTGRGNKERLEQLQTTVSDLLGVTVDAFSVEGSSDAPEIDVDDFLVHMNGTGIRESLRLILDMEFSKPDLMLIEEPEVHLHFELERKIFKYLLKMSDEVQIFMTTHSTGFIDASETNNILLVKKEEDTKVSNIETEELTEVINELGINISSLLLSKVIVFVEGPTDEEIVRMYLETFHPNLSFSDVGVIQMTGVGNYQHYANSRALEVFNSYGLKTIFILDSDSRSEEEIDKIKARHPQTSELQILPKSCIENYFLKPSILLKFIQKKMNNAGLKEGIPTEENLKEIQEQMDEIVESLYPETLRLFIGWKYLKPIYPVKHFSKDVQLDTADEAINWIQEGVKQLADDIANEYSKFEETLPIEIEGISKIWKDNKLNIVPGSKVFDLLCKKYGIRYNKKKTDMQILSQTITRDEWPTELKDILGRVVRLASE